MTASAKSTKRYYWIKLKQDFFGQKEIKKLRKLPGGDTLTIIFLKLQLLSLNNNGIIYFDGIENSFEKEIALERVGEAHLIASLGERLTRKAGAVVPEFLPRPSAPSGRSRVLQIKVRTSLYEIAGRGLRVAE